MPHYSELSPRVEITDTSVGGMLVDIPSRLTAGGRPTLRAKSRRIAHPPIRALRRSTPRTWAASSS